MSAIAVLAGAGVIAVSAAVVLAVLIIGIHQGDRHHLADAPRPGCDALARRLLVGVRHPGSAEGEDQPEGEDQ
jgi:hypothetical protein